jgi:hypothetical protein
MLYCTTVDETNTVKVWKNVISVISWEVLVSNQQVCMAGSFGVPWWHHHAINWIHRQITKTVPNISANNSSFSLSPPISDHSQTVWAKFLLEKYVFAKKHFLPIWMEIHYSKVLNCYPVMIWYWYQNNCIGALTSYIRRFHEMWAPSSGSSV